MPVLLLYMRLAHAWWRRGWGLDDIDKNCWGGSYWYSVDEEEGGAVGRDAVEDDTVERERVMVWREGVMLWREDSEGRELCHTGNKVYRRMH